MFCMSVPVKTNPGFLGGALDSLREQNAACSIALLDASGDPAVPAAADASGLEFAWRRHGADGGQAAAIAEGWRQAPGDILGWLNDDDVLLPGALDSVAAIFAAEPETDVVYGHGVMLDAAGAFTGYFPSISPDASQLRFSNVICQPAAFVRRPAVDRIGGIDPALHYAMDWDLWLRLLDAGARFRFIDAPLAAVRSHADSKTRSGGAARWREIHRLMAPRLSRLALWRLRCGLARSEARENHWRLRAAFLDAIVAIKQVARPPRALTPILGLDPGTNRVEHRGQLVMPVFTGAAFVDLRIDVDRDLTLTATADAAPLSVRRGSGAQQHTLRISSVPVHRGAIRCALAGDGRPWHLLRAAPASLEPQPGG
jgi:GT2 family glycosyltransferase